MKDLKKILVVLYLLALLGTSIFPMLEIQGFITILVVVRFVILLIYYLISSKNIDHTLVCLIALNILADLIFVQEDAYSFLLSMSVFLVINLIFSYLIYKHLTSESESFKVFLIPVLILIILSSYLLITLLEDESYLFFIYSFSLVLLVYSGVLYYKKMVKREGVYMLLGASFLFISAIFTWLNTFIETNKYYALFDTIFYGLALLLITAAVIFEDNNKRGTIDLT